MSRGPFTLGVVTRQISRRYQEEDDDDYEGGAEGNGAEATDGAVGVPGTGRCDDYGGDEGGLLAWVSVIRHICKWVDGSVLGCWSQDDD